jgi:hypothetical protein
MRRSGPNEQVLVDFDRAIDMIAATIRKQSADDLVLPYSNPTQPDTTDRFGVFMPMAAHAYHQVGQIIYLAKELTKPVPQPRVLSRVSLTASPALNTINRQI